MINYTNVSKDAIKSAELIAKNTNSSFVGTEHMLYGILDVGKGIAYEVLEKYGISKLKVLSLLENKTKKSNVKIAYTPKLQDALNYCERFCKDYKVDNLGSEIILFSILRQSDSMAIDVIKDITNNFQELFDEISNIINEMLSKSDLLDPITTSYIDDYCINLNEKCSPVFGREKEIERVFRILSRKTKNNPCLVGEAGVGKTAIVEGMAYLISNNKVSAEFKNLTIYAVDLSRILAGTKYRGEFEERIKKLLDEATQDKSKILFFDEIHTIIGAGSTEGTLDCANILKPLLDRGSIRIIGATTTEEYRKRIEKDSALERRFGKVFIEEPSKEETLKILEKLKPSFEKFHCVSVRDDVLREIVELSDKYIHDRNFPDKAIDVLDEACAFVKNQVITHEKDSNITKEAEKLVKSGNIFDAINIDIEEENQKKSTIPKLDKRVIKSIISNVSNVPIEELQDNEFEALKNLEANLNKSVIGQEEAIKAVSQAIKRGKINIKDPRKPIGSFMFLGPTGCGKTETCKALAKELFGSQDAVIRFDMSEYMEKHSVAKLIGSPPGYVGFEDGGQLTGKVRKKPYSIVLFDEIEKAHPDIFNILLQILDEGTLTDSNGVKVDFKNTIIIMTSNIGAKEYSNSKKLGFSGFEENDNNKSIEKNVINEVKKVVSPEFYNRIDELIVFNKLSKKNIEQIAKILVTELIERLEINIKVSDELFLEVVKEGYSDEYGARPLKRAIQKLIENPIADYIISKNGKVKNISLNYVNGKTTVVSVKKSVK